LNNESVWYKVNEFTGKAFISSGIAIITLTFAALWLGNLLSLEPAALQLLVSGVVLVPIAIAVFASGVVCHRG
jgi:uncharacterized membrane protein